MDRIDSKIQQNWFTIFDCIHFIQHNLPDWHKMNKNHFHSLNLRLEIRVYRHMCVISMPPSNDEIAFDFQHNVAIKYCKSSGAWCADGNWWIKWRYIQLQSAQQTTICSKMSNHIMQPEGALLENGRHGAAEAIRSLVPNIPSPLMVDQLVMSAASCVCTALARDW